MNMNRKDRQHLVELIWASCVGYGAMLLGSWPDVETWEQAGRVLSRAGAPAAERECRAREPRCQALPVPEMR